MYYVSQKKLPHYFLYYQCPSSRTQDTVNLKSGICVFLSCCLTYHTTFNYCNRQALLAVTSSSMKIAVGTVFFFLFFPV